MDSRLLADNETLVREYNYAEFTKNEAPFGKSKLKNTLIVTNKRIIHRVERKMGNSNFGAMDETSNNEIPINDVKYVNTAYARKRPSFLIILLGFIFIAVSSVCIVKTIDEGVEFATLAIGIISAVIGLIFVSVYLSPKIMLTVSLNTDVSFPSKGVGSNHALYFSHKEVKPGVAKQLTEELGAIIKNVQAGKYDEI